LAIQPGSRVGRCAVVSYSVRDSSATTDSTNWFIDRKTQAGCSARGTFTAAWTEISFPTRWHYDILWGLDYLRRAGVAPDDRMAEAIDLVRKTRDEHGRWPLENPHPGPVHFEMEGRAGEPSRWNTLRALRVLRWASAS